VYAEWVDELPKIIELQQARQSGGALEEALRDSDEDEVGEATATNQHRRVVEEDDEEEEEEDF
jgi:hypothetical protein